MNEVARVIEHHHDHDDAAQQIDGVYAGTNLSVRCQKQDPQLRTEARTVTLFRLFDLTESPRVATLVSLTVDGMLAPLSYRR